MRGTLAGVALLLLGAAAAEPPAAGPPPPQEMNVSARSRLYLRLDPSVQPDPDGSIGPGALGSFRVVARGDYWAEASGWIAHLPGSAARADDVVSGDVSTLLGRGTFGPVDLTVGRQWTSLGEQRISSVDGVVAKLHAADWATIGVRGGVGAPRPGEAFGDAPEVGGEAAFRWTDLRLALGVLNSWPDEAEVRTRLTLSADWFSSDDVWSASGAATVDAAARGLAYAHLEGAFRPSSELWLRAYARRARIDLLLQADELLAVFAEDARDELGGLTEYQLHSAVRLRVDLAAVGGEARRGGRGRLGVDFDTYPGARLITEGTGRTDREGRSGQLRVALRAPLKNTLFGTVESIGDRGPEGELAGLVRLGLGFEPWDGWTAYGAAEAAHTERWPYRIGGLALLEYTFGAPGRWSGAP